MIRALMRSCRDHLANVLAASNRFAAGQSSASACSSGSSVTFVMSNAFVSRELAHDHRSVGWSSAVQGELFL